MSIFSTKKSKAKKQAEKDKKEQVAQQPSKPEYKHVPRHAAADSIAKTDQAKGTPGTPRRLSREARDYALGNNASVYSGPQNLNPLSSQYAGRQFGGFNAMGMQRNNSAEVFMTDPDAPPLPTTAPSAHKYQNGGRSGANSRRNSTDYMGQHRTQPASDRRDYGNQSLQAPAQDKGYVNPHNSADSGYGSEGPYSTSHSRAPSEQLNLPEVVPSHLPRNDSGFLPELSLSEELAREPAFSEHSFGGDEPAETSARRAPEPTLHKGRTYFSQLDPSRESRAPKPSKLTKPKQTRFESDVDSSSNRESDQAARLDQRSSRKQTQAPTSLAGTEKDVRPESATLPQPHFPQQRHTYTSPAIRDDANDYFAPSARYSAAPHHRVQEQQQQYSLPARMSTPPPARDRDADAHIASPVRYSSPPPQSGFAPLEQVISNPGSVLPPTRILEGFKINKRGLILDEEGEAVGELSEGDLMDCVRRTVNAYGEVIDDYGAVVGRVRTLQRSQDSPIMRYSSPAPVLQQQHFAQPAQHLPTSPVMRRDRRESDSLQPSVFTPAWQQQKPASRTGLAQELRDHLATAPEEPARGAVPPLDLPGTVFAVELDATEPEIYDETLPIFDHSDVFVPPPFVPARSPMRTRTPSPPEQEQAQEHMRREVSQPTRTAAPVQRVRSSNETPRTQSKSKRMTAPSEPRDFERQPQKFMMPAPVPEPDAPQQREIPQQREVPQKYEAPQQREMPQQHEMARQRDMPMQQAPAQTEQPEDRPRPILRSPSEGSLGQLAKSYSRPAMSPVPENGSVSTEEQTSAPFSYKGEIPAADGPISNARLAPTRTKSPALPTFPRQAFTGGLPGGSPFAPMNSAQFSSAGSTGPRGLGAPRQFTTGVPGPRPIVGAKNSYHAPLKRSPLSSHETTPPESDEGSTDGDKTIGQAHGMHSRQPSVRTMASMRSMQSTSGKPRTYFTHAGRVTVDGDQPPPSQMSKTAEPKEAAPSISGSTVSKKKSRFSFGMGSKKGQAVAAH